MWLISINLHSNHWFLIKFIPVCDKVRLIFFFFFCNKVCYKCPCLIKIVYMNLNKLVLGCFCCSLLWINKKEKQQSFSFYHWILLILIRIGLGGFPGFRNFHLQYNTFIILYCSFGLYVFFFFFFNNNTKKSLYFAVWITIFKNTL